MNVSGWRRVTRAVFLLASTFVVIACGMAMESVVVELAALLLGAVVLFWISGVLVRDFRFRTPQQVADCIRSEYGILGRSFHDRRARK